MTTIPFTNKCKFTPAYSSRCQRPCIGDYCEEHDGIKCGVCGNQAVHGCHYCGQFVCGFPLCGDCEEFTDTTKASGAWGFLNHGHRLKKEHMPPVETKMVTE
jgi:hypothetical protein